MTVLQRDKHYHTYADYLTWSRDYGDELINGTAYVREPPAPGLSHQRVVGEIHRQVANALKGKPSRVYIAPSDVRVPESTEPGDQVDTVVQPGLLSPVDGASNLLASATLHPLVVRANPGKTNNRATGTLATHRRVAQRSGARAPVQANRMVMTCSLPRRFASGAPTVFSHRRLTLF